MYEIYVTNSFKKDIKRAQKRSKNLKLLNKIIICLECGGTLSPKYKDHSLTGNWSGFRECHIQPDWLLIYKIQDNTLILSRTGSHSDLF